MYDVFPFGIFLPGNFVFILCPNEFIFELCIYHYYHKQAHYHILYPLNCSFSPYFSIFLTVLSMTLKDIVLLLSKHLTYPIIWGCLIHNGLIPSLPSCSIKYLNDFFVPCSSLLETCILLISVTSILNSSLFLLSCFYFHCWNLYCFHSFLNYVKKCEILFYNNLHILWIVQIF